MEPQEHATILPRAPGGTSAPFSSGLPTDLLSQSARRLRVLGLTYALVFFLAGLFPALLFPEDRARVFSSPLLWVPPMLGILLGVVVALAVGSARLPVHVTMTLGLVFEVVSSYAIAAAEFADPGMIERHAGFMGLSWVAVWVVLFTIVVPTTPRRALMAALASVSAVPVVVGVVLALSPMAGAPNPFQFFFVLVFPYLLVVGMAYVGAGVVYQLGTEVKRARELGSYSLEEKLGQGGMGEVWRAKHRMLARPAAVKLIRPELAGAAFGGASQRFEREAQVIAGLRSPHTVTLFDFGMAEDGSFYYAMELLEGMDADRLVRKFGPMSPDRVIRVLRQVCHSLSEAQSRGLVHRDIKPANIFLCRYGEELDFVKVLDFGIVRAAHQLADANPTQTADLAIQGTPAFMAPEQALSGEVDGRTDIYATGCLAFWLLTGANVFHADTPIAMLMQQTQTNPFPPSARAKQPIPKELDQLVLMCLAKDPAQRPQSARDLDKRLAAIRMPEVWTNERAAAWWDQHLPVTR